MFLLGNATNSINGNELSLVFQWYFMPLHLMAWKGEMVVVFPLACGVVMLFFDWDGGMVLRAWWVVIVLWVVVLFFERRVRLIIGPFGGISLGLILEKYLLIFCKRRSIYVG